jgi:hypothetical protein
LAILTTAVLSTLVGFLICLVLVFFKKLMEFDARQDGFEAGTSTRFEGQDHRLSELDETVTRLAQDLQELKTRAGVF